jgi:acetyl-CoA synthetase
MATNLPGITPMIPGSCTLPVYGVDFAVLNPVTGQEILPSDAPTADDDDPSVQTGVLAIRQPWPGMARTCLNDHERFKTVYLKPYPGYYFTGDSVLRLRSNGYHFITGRVDDVLNVSGHRIGTAEVESALVLHPAVAQAAVVGKAHPIKGQSIVAFIMLTVDYLNQHDDIDKNHDELIQELRNQVRKSVGAFASPDEIFVSPSFPVTRSGKIMRRILRKIVAGETDTLGDTSTLADPSIVNVLIEKVEATSAKAAEQK